MDKMIANGDTPLCVGIESGSATGWPFTDWVEELVLRQQGIDYYNKWVAHKVPFNDQPVVDTFNEVAGPDGCGPRRARCSPRAARSPRRRSATTPSRWSQGKCMMHRQANFFTAFFPEGHEVRRRRRRGQHVLLPGRRGPPGPGRRHQRRRVPRRPRGVEGDAVPRLARVRQRPPGRRRPSAWAAASPGSSPGNKNADTSNWAPLEQGFLKELQTANPAAFDASDQMPAEVGSGTFWTEGTSFVNGDEDAKTAAANIQASWPAADRLRPAPPRAD